MTTTSDRRKRDENREHHDQPTDDLDRIAGLAEAATPGLWEAHISDSGHSARELNANVRTACTGDLVADCDWTGDYEEPHGEEGADARYIAAANPTAILALIERVRSAENWKKEALPVLQGLQELGRALGIRLGASITGEEAAKAAAELRERAERAEAALAAARAEGANAALAAFEAHHPKCTDECELCDDLTEMLDAARKAAEALGGEQR